MKFTPKMEAVQKGLSVPLEDFLVESVTEHGLTHTAEELGISKATLGYWNLKFGITIHRIALRRLEYIEVRALDTAP